MDFGKFEPGKERELERLQASFGPGPLRLMSLDLMRDDVEWRFILSVTQIATEKYARGLRVSPGGPPILRQSTAEAEIYFVTGECVLDRKP